MDTTSATFSLELDFGASRCGGRESESGAGCGRDRAHANRGVARGLEREQTTSGTCGPRSENSSSPADLPLFLESKSPAPQLSERLGVALQRRLSRYGSMEYAQTWKLRVTPLGHRYWAHTASGRRTSGSGCTGSPTPRANDAEKRGEVAIDPRNGLVSSAALAGHPTPNCPTGGANTHSTETHTGGMDLEGASMLAGHPTPQHHDTQEQGKGRPLTESGRIQCHNGKDASLNLPGVSRLAGHPSPRAEDSEQTGAHRGEPDALNSCSKLAGRPTCSARDWKDTPGMATTGINPDGTERSRLDMLPRVAALAGHATPRVTTNNGIGNPDRACDGKSRLEDQCLGATTASTDTSTAKTGAYRLNPGFSLWLMIGIPTTVDVWASCGVRAMLSLRRVRRNS